MTEQNTINNEDKEVMTVPVYQGSFSTVYEEGRLEASIDWRWNPGTLAVHATIMMFTTPDKDGKRQDTVEGKPYGTAINFAVYMELPDNSERCNVCLAQQRCVEEVVNPAVSNFMTDLHSFCPDEE